MNKVYSQIATYFLLLCMLAAIIPVNFFHQHIEKSHCDKTDASLENNPCHISVYHQQLNEENCEHTSHFSDFDEACELCKFLSPRRFYFTAFSIYEYKLSELVVSKDCEIAYEALIPQYHSTSRRYRGPPNS